MNDKTYLADSVGELQAELDTVRVEMEQVKLNNARYEAVNQQQAKDLERMRAAYTDRNTECIQLRTLLEQMGTMLAMGLERYRRQNMARSMEPDHNATESSTVPPRQPQQPRSLDPSRQPRPPRPVESAAPIVEPPPLFLQRPGQVRTDVAHLDSRLPQNEFLSRQDQDRNNLEEIAQQIEGTTRRQS